MSEEEILDGLYFIKNWKCNGDAKMHSVIEGAIHALLKKREEEKWVLCSERLPEVNQRVLAQHRDGSMAVKRCIDGGHLAWFYAGTVAWKPAPAPYQEEKT